MAKKVTLGSLFLPVIIRGDSLIKPLFIFSLPRSGSTLLQRLLAANPKIASTAEPWILLPFLYSLKESGVYAEYSHHWAHVALDDFLKHLPNGKNDYLAAVSNSVLDLYQRASGEDALYYLDKTPRYSLISSEIVNMFPDGKFIFLWRNPLSIIASMIETWGQGKWNVFVYKVDLFKGMPKLIESYMANSERVLSVQYESLVGNAQQELGRISNYLEMDIEPEVLESFSKVNLLGEMGDPTGVKKYGEISSEPVDKWKKVINNPYRKLWCRRYLHWIGEENLKVMGYDLEEMLYELESIKTSYRYLFWDVIRIIRRKVSMFPELKWKKNDFY